MAYNETRITLVGVVAGKVAHSTVGTGFSRARFRMHTTERRFDRETGGWVAGASMFLTVTCWRQLADNVHRSLGKGDPVMVAGILRVNDRGPEGGGKHIDVEAGAVGPNLLWCTAQPVPVHPDPGGPRIVAPRTEEDALVGDAEQSEELKEVPF
ncbi:single-stranded DNA-binding protein [Actinosynnema sp. NPDC020468]|uniref:single-stranded DNA-binding protein n=1 Tax=Actinosynnema sp. NPDC020468 TaxID=3154488 RepID=UPI0033DE18A0